MTDVPEIIDLESVVDPYLNGCKLHSYTRRYLTKPGDNYGSVLLAIDAKIQTTTGVIRELPLVAKIPPPITNKLLWQMFQPEKTCPIENAVYTTLDPALRKLQLESGIKETLLYDGLSKYYGSRTSLCENSVKVDENAILVQENLQTSGFKAGNRHKMFDLKHAEIILQQVAQFHALPVALRLRNADEFDMNIRPNFRRFDGNSGMTEETKLQFEQELIQDVALATDNNENILQRVKELLKDYDELMALAEISDDLYTTIVHFDMWINNFMIKYDENDQPCQVKLVDFQMAQYDSLVYDVIFFLFSSVEAAVLDNHMDDLLLLYYKSFIKCLTTVGVSTKDYSFVSFMKEVHKCAPVAICLCLFMIRIILADESVMPENIKDMDMNVLGKNDHNHLIIQRIADVIRLAQKYKLFFKD